jgi:hypothetical protein
VIVLPFIKFHYVGGSHHIISCVSEEVRRRLLAIRFYESTELHFTL